MAAFSYAFAGSIGALVGLAELFSRYQDEPLKTLGSPPALFYLLVNASASLGALAAINVFDWNFGVDPSNANALLWTRMLVAGFGAMGLFRSSLFTVRAGSEDVPVGPGGLLTVLLKTIDSAVDRSRASVRAKASARIMAGISFDKAHEALPAFALGLMQQVPADDQQRLSQEVIQLAASGLSESAKSLNLGLLLINYVGERVLAEAVEALGDEIKV